MRVVVTGGRGFIGRSVAAALAADGHEVRALDNGWRSTAAPPPGVTLEELDVRDRDGVERALRDTDVVLHLAAIQGTANFYELPELVLDVNIRGVLNVAESCARAGVGRLLFASSSEVYGIPTTFPTPEEAPLVVPDPLNPRWSYGGSKIIGELAAIHLAGHHGYEFTILRYHNVYGPDMGSDHVIPQFISRLEREETFSVQGDGTQRRSFCYIDDAVAATVAAATSSVAHGQIFNVGNPSQEFSINDVIELLRQISGRSIAPQYIPFEGGGTTRRLPDVEKARSLLGFEPTVSLEEGLRRTYEWYARALR